MERYLAPFKFFNVWRRPPKEHHQSLQEGTLDDMRIKPSAPRTKNNFPSIIYFFWMKYYRKGPFKKVAVYIRK